MKSSSPYPHELPAFPAWGPGAQENPGLHLKSRDKLGGGMDMQQHQGFWIQGATQQPASQLRAHLKTNRKSGFICLAVLYKGT